MDTLLVNFIHQGFSNVHLVVKVFLALWKSDGSPHVVTPGFVETVTSDIVKHEIFLVLTVGRLTKLKKWHNFGLHILWSKDKVI